MMDFMTHERNVVGAYYIIIERFLKFYFQDYNQLFKTQRKLHLYQSFKTNFVRKCLKFLVVNLSNIK